MKETDIVKTNIAIAAILVLKPIINKIGIINSKSKEFNPKKGQKG